jgi:hypothetical protein
MGRAIGDSPVLDHAVGPGSQMKILMENNDEKWPQKAFVIRELALVFFNTPMAGRE